MYDLFYNLMIHLRQHLKRNDHHYVSCLSEQIWKLWYVKVYKIMKISENYLADSLGEKCANTEFFSGPYFSDSDWIRRDTKYFSVFSQNAEKIRVRKNFASGHFSSSDLCNLFHNVIWRFSISFSKTYFEGLFSISLYVNGKMSSMKIFYSDIKNS